MSYIGTITFIQMVGPQIPLLAAMIEPIDRSGTNGTAFRSNALKAAEVEVRTIEWVLTESAARESADMYALLKGQKVVVSDDLGRSVSNVMVLDCRVLRVRALTNPVPTGYSHQVEGVWVLKPTA